MARQNSIGGKQRFGSTKMGQREMRRLLITGAMAVVRWARVAALHRIRGSRPCCGPAPDGRAFSLDNKMARGIWAMLTRSENWEIGFRSVTNSRRLIRAPSDLEGLKIRVTPNKAHVRAFQLLGANLPRVETLLFIDDDQAKVLIT